MSRRESGTVIVIAYDNATQQQIEADVRFWHEGSMVSYRLRTHTPKGGFVQIGWPLGRYRFIAEAPGYHQLEGTCELLLSHATWRLSLTKEGSDA